MEAIDNRTGEVLHGVVHNGSFVVESGPDFDPRFEVYDMSEVSPVVAALMADAVEFPTELDNAFPDGDMEAREQVAEDIEEERERAQMQALAIEFVTAGAKYMQALDNTMAAIEHAAFDYWEKDSA